MLTWINELDKSITGDILIDEKTLVEYSHDASIFEVTPTVVIFPKSKEDIISIVKFVNKKKKQTPNLSITTRAAGTDMTGGPLNTSIILVLTKYLNKIKELNPKKLQAIVEPGVYFRDFEQATTQYNLLLPSYPASKSLCALGGMIANNSGGEKSLQYGKTNQYIQELKVILFNGKEYTFKKINKKELRKKLSKKDFEGKLYKKIYNLLESNYKIIQDARPHVSKNSAGYYLWDIWNKKTFDLTQLFVGSQGTLGIITEAKLKLIKKKKYSRLITCFLKDIEALAEFVNTVLPFRPESLETFDDKTLKLAIRFMPEISEKLHKNFISLAFSFWREAFITLSHGIPKFTVLVELTDDNEKVLKKRIQKLDNKLKQQKVNHLVLKPGQEEKYWTIRRESFNLLRQKIKNKSATPFIDDFIIKPGDLPRFIPELKNILKKHEVEPTFIGHAGSGNFHIIPLMDLTKKSERDKIPLVSEEVYKLIKEYKGSITAEHNDGLIRSPYLERMYGSKIMKLFERTKGIFDPKGIFNPGKKVYSDIKYSMKHIKKS